MESKRIDLYNICKKAPFKNFHKKKLIGSGEQGGDVFKYCINKNTEDEKTICIAAKTNYLNEKEAKYINNMCDLNAFKYSVFIEYASMQLTNQLILQGISPHYALNYQIISKDRISGACVNDYPYKITFLNELIEGITYDEWVRGSHTYDEWMNAYFQIIIAIYTLQKFYNMTHLDLHAQNILVKKVEKGGYWKYIIDGIEYFVPNLGYSFYIIDFGHAWIPGKFKSWFIRQRYNPKKIHKGYDIMTLFKFTSTYSRSPEKFKKMIRTIINNLREEIDYTVILKKYWIDYTIPKKKIIDTFDLNKKIIKNF